MNIAVFGATGLTGGLVVERALAAGHRVSALVRNPDSVSRKHERLTVIGGSPTSAADVEASVRGADVVIHCLGVGGKGTGKPTTLISDSVKATLSAMEKHGVPRIVCMSNVGTGGSGPWLLNRVVVPLFLRWLMPIVDDKERMESALKASSVEWIAVRLVAITEGAAKPVRTTQDGRGLGFTITASSAAEFLLARATGAEFLRQTPSISN
ncbi:MAG: NAD(P)H-binding protein [Polyangiaceae bacterium]|nr:NAD(P)H-binding protein [Polyangiaceae bacterium]